MYDTCKILQNYLNNLILLNSIQLNPFPPIYHAALLGCSRRILVLTLSNSNAIFFLDCHSVTRDTFIMVKIFIGNLSPDTTSDELRSLFSQYGKIAECTIVKNFGFVHMDDKAEAEEAIRNLHQYELNGQPMNVELSRGKSRGSTKLHVGNIACTNQELRAKFEEYGAVVECDIVKNYAFVHMERMEDAMEAISQLDNTAFKGDLLSWTSHSLS